MYDAIKFKGIGKIPVQSMDWHNRKLVINAPVLYDGKVLKELTDIARNGKPLNLAIRFPKVSGKYLISTRKAISLDRPFFFKTSIPNMRISCTAGDCVNMSLSLTSGRATKSWKERKPLAPPLRVASWTDVLVDLLRNGKPYDVSMIREIEINYAGGKGSAKIKVQDRMPSRSKGWKTKITVGEYEDILPATVETISVSVPLGKKEK